MRRIILVTGGARSGKSTFALNMADSENKKRAFVATAVAIDDEMSARIEIHKKERQKDFDTFEEPERLSGLMKDIVKKYDFIVVDCVTFFLNNLMFKGLKDGDILTECELILKSLKEGNAEVVFVTNEVGFGIVPDNPLSRRFRDLQGCVNKMLADASSDVYLMVSGIPLKIKGA
jgi:adenosylcobinamide kinase/adenosylcobinamide-phosphate guanylyltransferase